MFEAEESAFLAMCFAETLEDLGLEVVEGERGLFDLVVAFAAQAFAFAGVLFEVVDPAPAAAEGDLELDLVVGDGREGVFVAVEEDLLAVEGRAVEGLTLEEFGVVGDA